MTSLYYIEDVLINHAGFVLLLGCPHIVYLTAVILSLVK